jgi:hypothetical protein
MTGQRFALEWDRPFMPDALTHVSLFDGGKGPLYIVASGHGDNDLDALLDLIRTLRARNASADAKAFVAEEYQTLAKAPTRQGS